MLGALATIQRETFLRNVDQDKPKIKMAVTISTDVVQSQAHQGHVQKSCQKMTMKSTLRFPFTSLILTEW